MSNAPSVTLRAVERASTQEGYIVASTHAMTDQQLSDLLGAAFTLATQRAPVIYDREDRARWVQAMDLLIEARFDLADRPQVVDRFSSTGHAALETEDRKAWRARKLAEAERVATDVLARRRERSADVRERVAAQLRAA